MRNTSCFSGLRPGLIALCLLCGLGGAVSASALEEGDITKLMAQCRNNLPQLQKKAKAGNAQAQWNLSWCYEEGVGVERDRKQFGKWLRRSADRGNADAQYMLCLLLAGDKGDGERMGIPQNKKKGETLCRKAAAQGQPQAKELLENKEMRERIFGR